jgi:hypothetical protein
MKINIECDEAYPVYSFYTYGNKLIDVPIETLIRWKAIADEHEAMQDELAKLDNSDNMTYCFNACNITDRELENHVLKSLEKKDNSRSVYETISLLNGVIDGSHSCMLDESNNAFDWLGKRLLVWGHNRNIIEQLVQKLAFHTMNRYRDWLAELNSHIDDLTNV